MACNDLGEKYEVTVIILLKTTNCCINAEARGNYCL
jgi:hypothetical protein